jgi:hypothetical protein
MHYLGDYAIGDSVFITFNTRDFTSHAPATLTGGAVSVYRDAVSTPITAGTFLVANFNSVVGLNHADIVATAANGYIPGSTYWMVLTAGTVGGVSMIGEIIGSFSIANRSNIRNYPGGSRALMIDANGVANANVINVAGTQQTAGDLMVFLGSLHNRTPSALVGGRMDASVGAMAADVVTAAALAADAGAEIRTGLATQVSVSDIQSRLPITLIGGLMDSSVRTIMPNAVNASALATDAVQEIQAGLATAGSVTGLATAAAVAALQADTDDIQSRIPLALDGGRMNSVVNDMPQGIIDHINEGMATAASLAGVQADTDNIQLRLPAALVNGRMDSNVGAMAPDTLTASALAADAVAEIAAAMDAIATATEIADAILRRNVAGGSDGVRTVSEALYALRNKTEIVAGFLKVYQTDDATVAFQGPVTTAPGDPLTSFDPA